MRQRYINAHKDFVASWWMYCLEQLGEDVGFLILRDLVVSKSSNSGISHLG